MNPDIDLILLGLLCIVIGLSTWGLDENGKPKKGYYLHGKLGLFVGLVFLIWGILSFVCSK